jgi:hypothetical protein
MPSADNDKSLSVQAKKHQDDFFAFGDSFLGGLSVERLAVLLSGSESSNMIPN